MANVFLTDLTELTTPDGTELLYVVHDPSGTPVDRKCTLSNLLSMVPNATLFVDNLGEKTSGFTATEDKANIFEASGTWAVTIPTGLDDTITHTLVLDFSTSSSSQPTLFSSGNIKWKNNSATPVYSTTSGLRNIITLTTRDGGNNWIAEHQSYGGIETTFTQPVLSANGTIGGASFAVLPSSIYSSSQDAWRAFNNNTSDAWNTGAGQTGYLTIYNPTPLKLSRITKRNNNPNNGVHLSGSLYGSNDDVTYTKIMDYTNSNTGAGASWNIDIAAGNRAYYKYYRDVISTATDLTFGAICSEYNLTGFHIAVI